MNKQSTGPTGMQTVEMIGWKMPRVIATSIFNDLSPAVADQSGDG